MTARQSSERVPNADRAFLGPSAESWPQKFERSYRTLRSPALALIVSFLTVLGYRASSNILHSWSPQAAHGIGALTENPNKPEMPS